MASRLSTCPAARSIDFATIDVPAQLAADLALLTAHRSDLVADRARMTNRLRDVLTGVFPALERSFGYSNHKGALVLVSRVAEGNLTPRLSQNGA